MKSVRRSCPRDFKPITTRAPSRAQVWLAASALSSIVLFITVFAPPRTNLALAADPKGSAYLDERSTVSRHDVSLVPGTGYGSSVGLLNASGRNSIIDSDLHRAEEPQNDGIYFSKQQQSQMKSISVGLSSEGGLSLSEKPSFAVRLGDHFVDRTPGNNYIFYTLDPELQQHVSHLAKNAQAGHVAIVVMNPRTGKILAMAGDSPSISNLEFHAGFPAASLFKVVTSAAAIEQAGVTPTTMVAFRGGNYTLTEANYIPNPRLDRRSMSVAEALGRSCNPVFGQLGSQYINGSLLRRYTRLFGFNQSLSFEVDLPKSVAQVPSDDRYQLSRTAAGFGDVNISPIHAAALMSGIANGGMLPRPQMVEKIVSPAGAVLHRPTPDMLQRIVNEDTASTLMEMMEYTTTIGTSRREFLGATSHPTLGSIRVAAKTGTLSGTNPEGLNNWFIAAAPINNPKIAVAVVTVDAQRSSKASLLGRRVFEKFFGISPAPQAAEPIRSRPTKSSRLRTIKRPAYRSISPVKKSIKSVSVKSKKAAPKKVVVAKFTSKSKSNKRAPVKNTGKKVARS